MISNTERLVARLGGTLEQAARLHAKNASELAKMHSKAKASGKKVNGYTEAQLAKFARASELRAEWTDMLAQNDKLRAMRPDRDENSSKWLDAERDNVRTLLSAIDGPKPAGPLFAMKLASVGNPDMGQYHREGVASPTLLVESDSLATLVKIHEAYVAVYDLGGGNMPRGTGDVYRENVMVARVSYNGRVWTPGEYPNCKEIDPSTGAIKAA